MSDYVDELKWTRELGNKLRDFAKNYFGKELKSISKKKKAIENSKSLSEEEKEEQLSSLGESNPVEERAFKLFNDPTNETPTLIFFVRFIAHYRALNKPILDNDKTLLLLTHFTLSILEKLHYNRDKIEKGSWKDIDFKKYLAGDLDHLLTSANTNEHAKEEYYKLLEDLKKIKKLIKDFRQENKTKNLSESEIINKILESEVSESIKSIIKINKNKVSRRDFNPNEIVEFNKEANFEVLNEFDAYWTLFGKKTIDHLIKVLTEREEELVLKINKTSKLSKIRTQDFLPTLDLFPQEFSPLKIIVGGYSKKKIEPEHFGDLFRESQSFTNLHYLLNLKLPSDTEIISDQLLLEMNENERIGELGNSHSLVIGSPLVNAVTRHLVANKHLIFNFQLQKEAYELEKILGSHFYDGMKSIIDTTPKMNFFSEMLPLSNKEIEGEIKLKGNSRKLNFGTLSKAEIDQIKELLFGIRKSSGTRDTDLIIKKFEASNLFCPFSDEMETFDNDKKDVALISLGENVWNTARRTKELKEFRKQKLSEQKIAKELTPKYSLITVFGYGKIPTAKAIQALGKDLNSHPLGGFLKITKDDSKGVKQVRESSYDWISNYTNEIGNSIPKKIEIGNPIPKIEKAVKSFNSRQEPFNFFESEDEIKKYKEIIEPYLESYKKMNS